MDIGQGLASMGNDIADAMQQYHKEHEQYDQALSTADALSRLGITNDGHITPAVDAQGKSIQGVTPIIDSKAVDLFKTNVGSKRSEARGALQALARIGISQIDTIRKSQAAQGGSPFLVHGGKAYLVNPKTGSVKPDVAIARNEQGVPVTTQYQQQMAQARMQQQMVAGVRKGFNSSLQGLGISSPVDLFDSGIHQGGVIDQEGRFQQVPDTIQETTGGIGGAGAMGLYNAGVPPAQTHVRIGYVKPTLSDDKKKVIDKGRPGAVVPSGVLSAYQDQAAALAGPEAVGALNWLRQNPNSELAPQVQQKFRSLIAQSSSQTVPVPSQTEVNVNQGDSGEDNSGEE
jgi:hypothetical protein